MSDLDPKAKDTGATPTVAGDGVTFFAKVIAFAKNVKESLDSLKGIHDPLDGAVTWRSLVNLGLVELNGGGRKTWKGGAIRHGSSSIGLPAGAADSTSPPAPTGFSASAGMATSILTWTEPDYSNHSYTEVWRNTSNTLTGATMIGAATGNVYADNVGVTAGTRYYWIRHISTAGIIGSYQATSGTSNTTLQVLNADLANLIVDAAKLADSAVTSTKIANAAVGTAAIATAAITNALIANLAVDNAKISDLSASKLTAGTIDAATITVINLTASNITAGTLNVDRIAGGALDTIKLATDSMSSFSSGYNASRASGGTAEFDVLGAGVGVSVTTADATQKILLMFTCSATTTTATQVNHIIRIREGSTSGTNRVAAVGSTFGANGYATLSCQVLLSPGAAGTYTFYPMGQSDANATFTWNQLVVTVLKR